MVWVSRVNQNIRCQERSWQNRGNVGDEHFRYGSHVTGQREDGANLSANGAAIWKKGEVDFTRFHRTGLHPGVCRYPRADHIRATKYWQRPGTIRLRFRSRFQELL